MSDATFQPIREGTLGHLLRRLAAERGDSEALVYPAFARGGQELRHSFASLDAYVDELSRGLIGLGIEAGDHVAIWAANVPDWVPLEFALARIGAVLVTVNTSLQKDEVAYVLGQSHAVAVLHGTAFGSTETSRLLDELIGANDERVARLRLRVWLAAHPDEAVPEVNQPGGVLAPATTIADLLEAGRTVSDAVLADREQAVSPEAVVNIQYTSGTTGFPKGVMLSHVNLMSNANTLGDLIRITPADRTAMMVPLFHCFGCVVAVLGSYTHGAALCCIQAFAPGDALRLIDEERCSVVHGVPTMFSAMLAQPDVGSFDTTSLRSGVMAGAPCPEPLMLRVLDELHCQGMCVCYGLTEASPGVSGSSPEDDISMRCGTIGRALPGVEIRVVDPITKEDVPDGAEGELWARGANIMVGYHDNPDATADAIVGDGWLRTGDLVTRDDQGVLRVVGRSKDIIIRGGENIAPAEVENVLREHPDIVDAAVVGVPDERLGEEVAAALILKEGAVLDPNELVTLLTGRVAPFKVPRIWRTLEAFPLTGSGKVQKFKLREQLAD